MKPSDADFETAYAELESELGLTRQRVDELASGYLARAGVPARLTDANSGTALRGAIAHVHQVNPGPTAAQTRYILTLLEQRAARTRFGETVPEVKGPTTRAEIWQLKKAEATAYIDALKRR